MLTRVLITDSDEGWGLCFPHNQADLWHQLSALQSNTILTQSNQIEVARLHRLRAKSHNDKGLYSQSYGFFSSHVWMWELDHKEGWAQKNRCFQIVVLEKTLESPFDYRYQASPTEINPARSLEGLVLKLKL